MRDLNQEDVYHLLLHVVDKSEQLHDFFASEALEKNLSLNEYIAHVMVTGLFRALSKDQRQHLDREKMRTGLLRALTCCKRPTSQLSTEAVRRGMHVKFLITEEVAKTAWELIQRSTQLSTTAIE